ncbi:hypothetical protein ACU5AX_12280 [Sphingomonas sp. XXL09]|uniref:hypothetical protein n=1 Tax=Sphingomonas sp. XXL09 TaxID=3457787 RepID=UPI00406BB8FC
MKWLLASLAVASGAPLAARDLPVPPGKGWQHAETGLILTAQLAGLSRTALTDATASEHDVAAQFESPDKDLVATVYIFHPAIADAGLWFDRSRVALEHRDIFRNAAPVTADPVGVSVTGHAPPTGLEQVYALPGGAFRSTALAVVPVGKWIVSVRMSAHIGNAQMLGSRLSDLVKAIRWPAAASAAGVVAATPIKACPTPLSFNKAKVVKPNGSDLLMSLVGSSIVAKQKADKTAPPATPVSWCRDGDGSTEYGVYRANGETVGYTLALYDAGRSVTVFPSLMGQIDKTGTYSVTLADVDGSTSVFPSFSAMPAPKQVWDVVAAGQRSGTMKGNTMTVDPKAL